MTISEAERAFHRKQAANSFNAAWDLLDKKRRSPAEDRRMLDLAHASLLHWRLVGAPRQQAVGEWQVSRVHAALGDADLAVGYARSCLASCKKHRLDDVIHTANEGLARAYAVAGDLTRATEHIDEARRLLQNLTLDREDRGIYEGQIRETELLIRSARRK